MFWVLNRPFSDQNNHVKDEMLGYHGTAYEHINDANRLPSRETWQNNAGTLTLYQATDTTYTTDGDKVNWTPLPTQSTHIY